MFTRIQWFLVHFYPALKPIPPKFMLLFFTKPPPKTNQLRKGMSPFNFTFELQHAELLK